MSPPEITVLYFAASSTATGKTRERIALPNGEPLPLTKLGAILVERYPRSNLSDVLAGNGED
jgi:hypothetical protein